MKTKNAPVSAARTIAPRSAQYGIERENGGSFWIVSQRGEVAMTLAQDQAEEIVRSLRLAAALPAVRAALELAEATYSNLSSAEFAVGDDKPAREAIRSALAALDAAGAA